MSEAKDWDEGDKEAKRISLSVALLLESKSGGLVLVKQAGKNAWGPIAGHIKDVDDNWGDAILREMWEEANLNIEQIEKMSKWEIPYVAGTEYDSMGVVWRAKARISDNEINSLTPNANEEIDQVRVFSQQEIYDMVCGKGSYNMYVPKYNVRNYMRWLIEKQQSESRQLLSTSAMK